MTVFLLVRHLPEGCLCPRQTCDRYAIIGTTTPTAKLDVSGSVKLGAAGAVITALKSQDFSVDFPNTDDGTCSSIDLTLPDDGVVTGVKIPNSPVASTSFTTGNSGMGGCTDMNTFRTNTGNTKVGVAFENFSGSSYNPSSVTFTVYYIVP